MKMYSDRIIKYAGQEYSIHRATDGYYLACLNCKREWFLDYEAFRELQGWTLYGKLRRWLRGHSPCDAINFTW